MSGRKTVPIPDRHSAHPPGKAEWKAADNRLSVKELTELTLKVGRGVRLRPSWRPSSVSPDKRFDRLAASLSLVAIPFVQITLRRVAKNARF